MEKVFVWRNSEINYITFGTGKRTLICFHGYGQNSTVFEVFKPTLETRYRVVSIDLPFQGKTKWREKEKLSPELLCDLMTSFLTHINASEKVSLMAYSIGGNYALGLAAAFPERIEALWLLAADGLKAKPAFDFVTKTNLGRLLFKNFILYPQWVFYSLKLARWLGITNNKTTKFYYSTMDSQLKRQALFERWSSTARISIQPSKAIDVINQYSIPIFLIYGIKDAVIPVRNAVQFAERVPTAVVKQLPAGHRLLVSETNTTLEELLSDKHSK